MPDRRAVDDLTIEELEQVLRLRKHQARMERLRRLEQVGRKRAGMSPVQSAVQNAEDAEESGLEYESFLREEPSGRVSWGERSLRDKLLLAVEMGAALTLFGVLVYAVIALRDINREVEQAQAADRESLPTPTATPIINIVVLPGGHTPPVDGKAAMPNLEEVPDYLKPRAEAQFSGPVIEPTIGPSMAERIQIPAIGVDATIVQGDGWQQLIKGVGQHLGTANPGEAGNMVLSAHNDIYGQIFRRLDELEEGDEIIVRTRTQQFRYVVSYQFVVDPTDVQWIGPSTDPIVTLISCYPYMIDNQRIVIVGELAEP